MPIRPENRDRYPADWPEISNAVKESAGWRCECEGECGRSGCKGRCPNRHGQPAYGTGSLNATPPLLPRPRPACMAASAVHAVSARLPPGPRKPR